MTDHARTHIKAMIDTLKEQEPGKLAQPAGLFFSGMLTGLTASTHILNGSTAEAEMERVETNLAAAIGNAYLNGTLPTTPPQDPADELRKINALLQDLGVEGELGAHGMAALANTVRCIREELRHAELAIARVRLVKAAPDLDERVRTAVHDALHALPSAQSTSIDTVIGVVAGAALAELHRNVSVPAATQATDQTTEA